MTGHVRERGKGNWYAVISTRDPAGRRKVKFISLPDAKGKTEAKRHLARIVTEMDSGAYVEPDKVTVAQFLERWLNHIKTQVEPNTFQRYFEYCTNNIIPALGDARLTKLRPEQVSDFYSKALSGGRHDGKDGGLSPRTVHHIHVVLKQALTQACVWRAISNNPAALVKPPKVARKEMPTVDTDATAKMIEAARGTSVFIPILLGVLCGLRRGEICGLRWRSVALDAGRLSVVASVVKVRGDVREKSPKNGKGRAVTLPPMLITELRRHRLQQSEGLLRIDVRLTDDHHVFIGEDGAAVYPSSVTRSFSRFLRRHGLPQIRFHDLRHSHATHLLAAGVHPKIAQERLGHSNIGITLDTYSHVLPGMQEDAVAKVDAAIQAALNKSKTK